VGDHRRKPERCPETKDRTLALWGVWLNGAMLALTLIFILLFVLLLGIGVVGYGYRFG